MNYKHNQLLRSKNSNLIYPDWVDIYYTSHFISIILWSIFCNISIIVLGYIQYIAELKVGFLKYEWLKFERVNYK